MDLFSNSKLIDSDGGIERVELERFELCLLKYLGYNTVKSSVSRWVIAHFSNGTCSANKSFQV